MTYIEIDPTIVIGRPDGSGEVFDGSALFKLSPQELADKFGGGDVGLVKGLMLIENELDPQAVTEGLKKNPDLRTAYLTYLTDPMSVSLPRDSSDEIVFLPSEPTIEPANTYEAAPAPVLQFPETKIQSFGSGIAVRYTEETNGFTLTQNDLVLYDGTLQGAASMLSDIPVDGLAAVFGDVPGANLAAMRLVDFLLENDTTNTTNDSLIASHSVGHEFIAYREDVVNTEDRDALAAAL
jgi:hypothetical protein